LQRTPSRERGFMAVEAPTRPLSIPDQARILVRANNWIGDVVMATPALRAIRTAFPNARVSVLAKPWVLPLLSHHPAVDRLLRYDASGRHRGVSGLIRLTADLRREHFHAAILFQRAFEAAFISFGARIPVRAGLGSDGRSPFLTHRVPSNREIMRLHRVRHNLAVLARLGVPDAGTHLDLPVGFPALARAERALVAAGIPLDRLCVGLNPGAAFGSAKRWKPDRFAAVALRLLREYGARGLIFGSASEKELAEEVCGRVPEARLVNLAGATSLEEAVALIGLCGLFVTNDSGLMHVAAALDVPLVSVFGPTDPSTTSPWCTRHRLLRREDVPCSPCMQRTCKEGHHLYMDLISTDDVFTAACELVSRYGADTPEQRRRRLPASARTVPVLDVARCRGETRASSPPGAEPSSRER